MRYLPGLVLAVTVGAASSVYTPSARAAGVYIGIGIPAPVIAAPVPVAAPFYYAPRAWFGPGYYYGPHDWDHGRYGYRHRYGYHRGYWGGYWGGYGYRRR